MKQIDIIGLKNFRIFDDRNGVLEELAPINILTGANNSGKSSLIKSFQMLKNSIKDKQFPFALDLTLQEHLLGDFDNILFNKENRAIVITLPFPFLGITSIYISLLFTIPSIKNAYHAKLRKIEVIDKNDNAALFSFRYSEATNFEKESHKNEFQIKLQEYKQYINNKNRQKADILSNDFLFQPFENPLIGYVEWNISLDNLKNYLPELLDFYKFYLENKNVNNFLFKADKNAEKTGFIPSVFINSFKNQINIDTWKDFIENKIKEGAIIGRETIGERDFEPDEFFSPSPDIEDILYTNVFKIIRKNIKWSDLESDDVSYSVIENCFKSGWKILLQRISTINYLSNIKEENSRIYNATTNSPFVSLLKEYNSFDFHQTSFINKYLKEFEIGKRINVDYTHKYQIINVSITTLENTKRDLVDFGYGIKQLIIILIQISVLAEKNKRTIEDYDEQGDYRQDYYIPSMLLIEEPETNLHPKWQSLLAKLFVEAYNEFNIQFIIETHSEYLIRRFQTLVADSQISGDSIKIFYLRNPQRIPSNKKQIETTNIQQDGSINYQIFDGGFFDENYNLELSLLNFQRDRFLREFNTLKIVNQANENKIIILEQKIDDFTNKLDISVYQHMINQRFDISKFTIGSANYLASGQFLLNNIDTNSDFSPVIIQYGRTIENELKDIFISSGIPYSAKLMLGFMQGSLEKFKSGTTLQTNYCSSSQLSQLQVELQNRFHYPLNLKIELLDNLRIIRNSAGHSGQTKTKQEAIDYIQEVNDFLDKWIFEKK